MLGSLENIALSERVTRFVVASYRLKIIQDNA